MEKETSRTFGSSALPDERADSSVTLLVGMTPRDTQGPSLLDPLCRIHVEKPAFPTTSPQGRGFVCASDASRASPRSLALEAAAGLAGQASSSGSGTPGRDLREFSLPSSSLHDAPL